MHTYLFVLSPPYSGSTVLWSLLATSPVISALPNEGQMLDSVKHIMREKPWDAERKYPWAEIRANWEETWDMSKSVLLEKSPPNIARAFDIEQAFRPAYFIAMVRDPYAFCEGRRRRYPSDIRLSAEFWASCARHQLRNTKDLANVMHFRYEDFAERPLEIRDRILSFLPILIDLDVTRSFKARSIRGRGARVKVQNFNREKIDRLSAADIRAVNSILKPHDDLMSYFGYQYLEPTLNHSLRHVRATVSPNAQRLVYKAKRLWPRRFR